MKKEELKLLKICPVCGYDQLDEPPYDEYGFPSYEVCSCCGFEYGFDDGSRGYTFEKYRKEWIDKGYKYFNKLKEPPMWGYTKLIEQLKNINKVNYKPMLLK